MVLPDSLTALLREGIHYTIEETQDTRPTFNDLIEPWGDEEYGEPLTFIQGYIVGQLFASASYAANMTVKRPLNKEEKVQVMNLVDEVRFDVRDLMTRLRNI